MTAPVGHGVKKMSSGTNLLASESHSAKRVPIDFFIARISGIYF